MRIVSQTKERLELTHRTMWFMLLMGLFSLGGAAWTWWKAEDWKHYIGMGLLVLTGVALGVMACNSEVVFDRRRGIFEARHRYLTGKTRTAAAWLRDVEAVVISQDSIAGNVLAVICLRLGGTDLPITMFGSPFPGSVHNHAQRIANFLRLPLMEKDRLVVESPEDQTQSKLQDFLGEKISRATFDRLRRHLEQELFGVRCPGCGAVERLPAIKLMEPRAYEKFAVKWDHATRCLRLICKTCYAQSQITPEQVQESLRRYSN